MTRESFHEDFARLKNAVLASPGDSTPLVRAAVAARAAELAGRPARGAAEVPATLAGYVEKGAREAYRGTDGDVASLLEAGFSEDAVFEITLAAALGAADARLERGLAALRGRPGGG